MLKCSPEAYARCPTREYCGDPNDATFAEGSECDRFNQMVDHSPRTNNNGPQEKVECETCLHCDVCDQSSRQMWSTMAVEKQCADFKDRSQFVEVVHGYWHIDDCDSGEPDGYAAYIETHCSKCGYELGAESGQYGWSYGDPFPLNYCPNCGAKMDSKRRKAE